MLILNIHTVSEATEVYFGDFSVETLILFKHSEIAVKLKCKLLLTFGVLFVAVIKFLWH